MALALDRSLECRHNRRTVEGCAPKEDIAIFLDKRAVTYTGT
ncbi:MAG: hypothetical protein ACKVIQ_00885 [Acidimicrobiales bacterium]|jgi:hypothetical protein